MIEYRDDRLLEPQEIARVFVASGIVRPTQDLSRLKAMFANANIVISAWDAERLVGVCRALSDFSYCCYLSDLAVDAAYQHQGIGRELVSRTQAMISEEVALILISAPAAASYYPKLGFEPADNAYIIRRKR